jgi:hypothetical protein
MKKLLSVSICLAGAALMAGCNTKTKATPENYIATLNAYFPEHPDCLLDGTVTFPYESSDPVMLKQMDALVAAQILESHKEPSIHVTRYTLTPTGTKAGPHLCYGHREVTSIDSSTTPALANGFQETQVVYHYKIMDMPVWAKTPEVVAAYPKMAHEASGDATDKATLALTGVGWSVPD